MITKEQYLEAKKLVEEYKFNIIEKYEDEQLAIRIQVAKLTTSRCCGRCDGNIDICFSDMVCDEHKETGCRICWPDPLMTKKQLEEEIGYLRRLRSDNSRWFTQIEFDRLTLFTSVYYG
jgi:hypothetical protein